MIDDAYLPHDRKTTATRPARAYQTPAHQKVYQYSKLRRSAVTDNQRKFFANTALASLGSLRGSSIYLPVQKAWNRLKQLGHLPFTYRSGRGFGRNFLTKPRGYLYTTYTLAHGAKIRLTSSKAKWTQVAAPAVLLGLLAMANFSLPHNPADPPSRPGSTENNTEKGGRSATASNKNKNNSFTKNSKPAATSSTLSRTGSTAPTATLPILTQPSPIATAGGYGAGSAAETEPLTPVPPHQAVLHPIRLPVMPGQETGTNDAPKDTSLLAAPSDVATGLYPTLQTVTPIDTQPATLVNPLLQTP